MNGHFIYTRLKHQTNIVINLKILKNCFTVCRVGRLIRNHLWELLLKRIKEFKEFDVRIYSDQEDCSIEEHHCNSDNPFFVLGASIFSWRFENSNSVFLGQNKLQI